MPADSANSNDVSFTTSINSNGSTKVKTPLKKEELEKIARQLKKKLSKASITAKQALSPTNVRRSSIPRSSPLKGYLLKNNRGFDASPNHQPLLSSSPSGNLYSPIGKSPTHIKTPAAMYLASSPLKNMTNDTDDGHLESPTKRRKTSPGRRMILEEISPVKPQQIQQPQHSLKPSIDLADTTNNQEIANPPAPQHQQQGSTTPTLPKKQLAESTIMRTPTQPRQTPSSSNAFNDAEGADLLMYLATSPSPAKTFYASPRILKSQPLGTTHESSQAINTAGVPSSQPPTFLTPHPPPPVTPKRGVNGTLASASIAARTPQNRLTPFLNNLNQAGASGVTGGLPSLGLTLTPTGFNMNDYVNFFTPSPGSISNNSHARNILKTPDFNSLMNGTTPRTGGIMGNKGVVDGKVLNFNKVLFGGSHNEGNGSGQKE